MPDFELVPDANDFSPFEGGPAPPPGWRLDAPKCLSCFTGGLSIPNAMRGTW